MQTDNRKQDNTAYLKVEVSSERNLVEEAQIQAIKATRVGRYLRDIIWQNKMISTKSKPMMYV